MAFISEQAVQDYVSRIMAPGAEVDAVKIRAHLDSPAIPKAVDFGCSVVIASDCRLILRSGGVARVFRKRRKK